MKQKSIKQCLQKTDDGEICKAPVMHDSDFCFFHNPEVTEERSAARRAGGIERSKVAVLPLGISDLPLSTSQEVVRLLAETINQVRKGQIDPRISNAVGYLSGILLKGLEQSDVEKRIGALESVIKNRQLDEPSLFDDDSNDRDLMENPI